MGEGRGGSEEVSTSGLGSRSVCKELAKHEDLGSVNRPCIKSWTCGTCLEAQHWGGEAKEGAWQSLLTSQYSQTDALW